MRLVLLLGAVTCSAGLLVLTLYNYYKWRQECLRAQHREEPINEVLFFPDRETAKLLTSSKQKSYDIESGSLSILMKRLQSAKQTLSVCMFAFSCHELSDILIGAHQRGVVVRVIVDNEQCHSTGSQIERLRRAGIQVRNDDTSYFMHHKFVIVDGQLLMSGSLNWTLQGVCGNQENVIVTNTIDLVQPFLKQFEHLWTSYDPELDS